jgi:hypothetical protein
LQQAMVWDIVPIPTKVVRSGMTGRGPVPLPAICHPAPLPSCLGSPEWVIGPPIQARLALTDIMSPDR